MVAIVVTNNEAITAKIFITFISHPVYLLFACALIALLKEIVGCFFFIVYRMFKIEYKLLHTITQT